MDEEGFDVWGEKIPPPPNGESAHSEEQAR